MKHCIFELARKYPQVLLPIKEGMRATDEYRAVCLRGEECKNEPTFTMDPNDSLETIKTPVGDVEVLTFRQREDFVHGVRALGYKCEPVEVPDSTGAMAIFGLNNWDKVKAGLDDYKDSLIILSSGYYSNVSKEDVSRVTNGELTFSDEEWTNASIVIRKYHELTHFIMRKLFPNEIKPIRDELIADMVGLVGAFGKFDDRLLKLFLGIEANEYREGGRLQNYKGGEKENIPNVFREINRLKELVDGYYNPDAIWKDIKKFM